MTSDNEPSRRFYQSSGLTFFLTVVSLIVSFVGIVPLVYDAYEGQPLTASHAFLGGIILVVFLLMLAASVYQFYHSQKLSVSDAAHTGERDLLRAELAQLKASSETKIDTLTQSLTERDSHYIRTAELFRDLARRRAHHAADLYQMLDVILRLGHHPADEIFLKSRELQKRFLEEVCSMVSDIFSHHKGGKCTANIKVIFDNANDKARHLALIEYGLNHGDVPESRIGYRTVARCYASTSDGRLYGSSAKVRLLSENVIFRDLYRKPRQYFIENDMKARIEHWRSQASRREIEFFRYPDAETNDYYSKLLVKPIYLSQKMELVTSNNLSFRDVDRFIGFLSIDSKSNIVFDERRDQTIADQLAQEIAGMAFEYFRCVMHLESRMGADPTRGLKHDRSPDR